MKLPDLLRNLEHAHLGGDIANVEISGVQSDSRAVEPGDLFVAVVGREHDGHSFVDQALANGASAVVVERAPDTTSAPVIVVHDAANALGLLAAELVQHPSRDLSLVGITGTNGKTTVSYLIESILLQAGKKTAVLGTVDYRWPGVKRPATYTTPPAPILQQTLSEMRSDGVTHAVLEVSSAALEMQRMAGTEFRVGVFTNLTRDHLDVHGSMDEYRTAKAKLFSHHLARDGTAVIFCDDPSAPAMVGAAGEHPLLQVSLDDADAAVRVVDFDSTISGIEAALKTPRGNITLASRSLIGRYNVANIAVAVAACEALDIPTEAIVAGIEAMPGVPGRVQKVENDSGLDILVDYAHTPDALRNVLKALRPLTQKRLICVFGCGGDRDASKRPLMGAAVSELADLPIVTSDNPRTEEPRDIIEMILPAVPAPFFVHEDRRVAIRAAVSETTPGDVVLIAGKGHEDYQIIGHEKRHFDDREEVVAAIGLRQNYPFTDIVQAIDGRVASPSRTPDFSRITIDTRRAAPGDLYVAIRGERFDGHEFCAKAVQAGASGLVISTEYAGAIQTANAAIIEVADPRRALGQISRWHRRRWGGPVCAITGSSGKTTTKTLLAAALSRSMTVHASAGSHNNETGVPLTLLGTRPYHEVAVVEMGMRAVGQIAELCEFAEPTVGVVVNAGTAHLGVVGSADGIARGKAEVFPPSGTAVYPQNDERLATSAKTSSQRISFGDQDGADVVLKEYHPLGVEGARVTLSVRGKSFQAVLPLIGRHNAINATCAIAAVEALGGDIGQAMRGLEDARPEEMRSAVREVAGRMVFLDCYNANPDSMAAALQTVAELVRRGKAWAVLGDMLELGDDAFESHKRVGELASSHGIGVIAIGEWASAVAEASATGIVAIDPNQAAKLVLQATSPGDWILIKASRGMRLERVLSAMQAIEPG